MQRVTGVSSRRAAQKNDGSSASKLAYLHPVRDHHLPYLVTDSADARLD